MAMTMSFRENSYVSYVGRCQSLHGHGVKLRRDKRKHGYHVDVLSCRLSGSLPDAFDGKSSGLLISGVIDDLIRPVEGMSSWKDGTLSIDLLFKRNSSYSIDR